MTLFSKDIVRKIEGYYPSGLDFGSVVVLGLISQDSIPARVKHIENVALISEAVAKRLEMDAKTAFFAGIMHGIGKCIFDGRIITAGEFDEAKKRLIEIYSSRIEAHLFAAYCIAFHLELYDKGHGLTADDFPSHWKPIIVEKLLEIAKVVAICDDVELFLSDGALDFGLKERPEKMFPNDIGIINLATEEAEKIIKNQ